MCLINNGYGVAVSQEWLFSVKSGRCVNINGLQSLLNINDKHSVPFCPPLSRGFAAISASVL